MSVREQEGLRERAARAAIEAVERQRVDADLQLSDERERVLGRFAREMRHCLDVGIDRQAVEWEKRRGAIVTVEGLRIGWIDRHGLTGSKLKVETEHGWRPFNSLASLHEALSYVPPIPKPRAAPPSARTPEVDPLDLLVEGLDRLGLLERIACYVAAPR